MFNIYTEYYIHFTESLLCLSMYQFFIGKSKNSCQWEMEKRHTKINWNVFFIERTKT